MKPLPGSNMKAKPHAQNVMPQMQVSTMPSTRMLIDSRDRAKPASSITKPTCMPKTRNAAISIHTVLIALISGRRRRRRLRVQHRREVDRHRRQHQDQADHLPAGEREHVRAHHRIAEGRRQTAAKGVRTPGCCCHGRCSISG